MIFHNFIAVEEIIPFNAVIMIIHFSFYPLHPESDPVLICSIDIKIEPVLRPGIIRIKSKVMLRIFLFKEHFRLPCKQIAFHGIKISEESKHCMDDNVY